MKFNRLSLAIFVALCAAAKAGFGPCRYDSDRCSCKMGEANQGICWDKLQNEPTRCSKRFCNAGWTCGCGGRTHVCYLGPKNVNSLVDPRDVSQSTAPCQTSSVSLVSSREILLGTWDLQLSRPGTIVNDCSQIALWHNGVLIANLGREASMSVSSIDAELAERENHSLLELRPGDLLAFRIKEGSYYCYKHASEMKVNGTVINTQTAGVTTRFARQFTKDWFLPSYELTPDRIAASEDEADMSQFVPLRPKKLVGNEAIEPGKDYWEARDDSNADNKQSNWYYRIQIPDTLPA